MMTQNVGNRKKSWWRKPSRLVTFGLFFTIFSCSTPAFDEGQWARQVESVAVEQLYETHQKDGIFYTPWVSRDLSFWGVVRWWLTEEQAYTEEENTFLPNLAPNRLLTLEQNLNQDLIVWIGHNTFLIKLGETVWLTDPIFSKRALLPPRVTPPAFTAEDINRLFPEVNVVISHNHHDHLDKDSILAMSPKTVFYVPLGMKKTIVKWRPESRIVEMDWWQSLDLGSGHSIHCLPTQHWSRRLFVDTNASLWASFMLNSPNVNVYLGGDSGYFIGYREIGRKFQKIDYALIPITAYHPRWRMHVAHMNVEEGIQAFHDLKAANFIPTQWGTFHLGDNPPGYPILDLQRVIADRALNPDLYLIPDLGEVIHLRSLVKD